MALDMSKRRTRTGTSSDPTPTDPVTGQPVSSGADSLKAQLDVYGLGGLADRAWSFYQSNTPSDAEFMAWLRQQPEYAARFPGMADLQKKGRAITEDEYISLERGYVQAFRQAGLPEGFYDQPSDFAGFISNEVSPQEMGDRLAVARTALYETPPMVRDELSRVYGLGAGDVMAFLLDPNKALPILQQQFTGAAAGAASRLAGFGLLTKQEEDALATTGRTFDQFSQGFDTLAKSGELFTPIIGEGNQDSLTRDEQLGAVFNGNTAAARRLAKRAQERAAAFQGGGSFAQSREGTSGLGSANT